MTTRSLTRAAERAFCRGVLPATGRAVAEFAVAGLPARMTVRELIRLRVREEVARHNARPSGRFHGLVRPDGAEAELNGYRLIMLAGDRQVEDLDEEVDLTADPGLVFIRLVPLAGG